MIWVFWIAFALIGYSLVGYGLLWVLLARLVGTRAPAGEALPLQATVLIAARNEEASIAEKLESILAQETSPHDLRVLVVSDGSEDATLERARSLDDPRITAFQTDTHGGKARALNAGLKQIDGDVVIFSDANSMLHPGAIQALLRHFSDPNVGGVCGQPEPIQSPRSGWLAKVEKIFWLYDSMLKKAESALGGAVSAQGTLYAMRRDLVLKTVPDAVADDFYISVQVPDAQHRLVYEEAAIAREEVTAKTGAEFMRRVRSTERGWRGLMDMKRLLNPARHGLYAVQLFSHKFLRRMVAFLLPVLLVSNAFLLDQGAFFQAFFACQIIVYGLGFGASIWPILLRFPGSKIFTFFALGHLAMAYGIVRAMFGVKSKRWSPVRNSTS